MKRECLKTARNAPFVAIERVLENAISIVNDYRHAGNHRADATCGTNDLIDN